VVRPPPGRPSGGGRTTPSGPGGGSATSWLTFLRLKPINGPLGFFPTLPEPHTLPHSISSASPLNLIHFFTSTDDSISSIDQNPNPIPDPVMVFNALQFFRCVERAGLVHHNRGTHLKMTLSTPGPLGVVRPPPDRPATTYGVVRPP
jgi:hypothetical protein